MPIANMTIDNNNYLILTFNDTIDEVPIAKTDLQITIYGSNTFYNFTWIAQYTSNNTVGIDMTIITKIYGNSQEQVVVEFLNPKAFKSVFSGRGANPESNMTAYLFENNGNAGTTGSLGQTAMILFLFSIFIAAVSSFGGNSMEMTWNLMNTLQILFYLSYVYVNFPPHLTEFFKYLKYANAENQYLAAIFFSVIPQSHFPRGSVSISIFRIIDK